jgi:hypothetical protein
VELLKRYSKNSYQGKRLRRVVEMVENLVDMPVRRTGSVPPITRVDRRLPAETIAELVQAYRDGVSTPELERRYELSHGSVIKILHGHGVEMRRQGLADSDLDMAAELYRAGQTLAQLGERFRVSPNAARRAVIAEGVAMRARGGSKPGSY